MRTKFTTTHLLGIMEFSWVFRLIFRVVYCIVFSTAIAFGIVPLAVAQSTPHGTNNDSLKVYLDKAFQLRQQKSYSDAIRVLRHAKQYAPESHAVNLELATILSWQREFGEAMRLFQEVLDKDSLNVNALNGLARIEMWQGKSDKAILSFEAILKDAPQNIDALLGLAFAYKLKQEYKIAQTYYEKVLAIVPEQSEATEGLRTLYPKRRTDVTITSGLLTVSEGQVVTQHSLEFSQQLRRPSYFVTGAAFRSLDNTLPQNRRTQSGVHLGLMRQFEHGNTAGASIYYSAGDFGTRYTLALDATKQLTPSWTILGTLRPGITQVKQFEWLAGGGALWQANARSYALVQYFYTHFYGVAPAQTLNATIYWVLLPYIALQPSAFFYRPQNENASTFQNYTFGIHFRWTERFSLGAHYGIGKDQPQRVGVSLRLRR